MKLEISIRASAVELSKHKKDLKCRSPNMNLSDKKQTKKKKKRKPFRHIYVMGN